MRMNWLLEVLLLWAKVKSFTDSAIVNECTSAVAETLMEGKQEQDLHRKQSEFKYWPKIS